jgi:hypothetical protein
MNAAATEGTDASAMEGTDAGAAAMEATEAATAVATATAAAMAAAATTTMTERHRAGRHRCCKGHGHRTCDNLLLHRNLLQEPRTNIG